MSFLWYVEKEASLPSEDFVTGFHSGIEWTFVEPNYTVEPAGRAYLHYVSKIENLNREDIESITAFECISDGSDKDKDLDPWSSFQLRDDLNAENVENFTFYELFGFEKYGSGVTEDLVRKAYRKAVLKYHPDKVGTIATGEEDEVFIVMQKAYETLMDPGRKRAYDSSLEFDDSIPTIGEGLDGDFFSVYGPVFERNARFAVILPVPQLGGDDDSYEDVIKFYEYWSNFQSWRDFTLEAAEHNLEDAEDRAHRRWMEKENAKKIKELKKKEYRRVYQLVENSKLLDPRIKRVRSAEAEAKQFRKEAKLAEKRAKEEAAVRHVMEKKLKEEAAAASAKAAALKAKAYREKLKSDTKAMKKKCREAFALASETETSSDVAVSVTNSEFEIFLEFADFSVLNETFSALKIDGSGGTSSVTEFVTRMKNERPAAFSVLNSSKPFTISQTPAKPAHESKINDERKQKKINHWTEEELQALSRAIIKFKSGTQSRWMRIAEFVSATTSAEQMRSKEECIAKFQELSSKSLTSLSNSNSATGNKKTESADATPRSAGESLQTMDSALNTTEDTWTDEQHRAFLSALARFPDSMEKNERWNAIANSVEGKTRSQCVNRFKYIKAKLLAKKKASAPEG